MKYTKIRLTGLESTDLVLQGASHDDLFICKGVDGLGPPEIDVSIAQMLDGGGYFQNKVPKNKQIIARIGLNPTWAVELGTTVSDLREMLYGMLTGGYTGDRVAVILMDVDPDTFDETEICRIYGYVSKFEIVPFSKDPQVQITIECLSPWYEALNPVFPTLGTMSKTAPNILNVGNGPTGFKMKFTFAGLGGGGIPTYEIETQGGLKHMLFTPPWNFVNGDYIEFSTVSGDRYATIYHGAVAQNALAWLSSDSDWLQLYGGMNILSMSSNLFNWNNIEFVPRWWGV